MHLYPCFHAVDILPGSEDTVTGEVTTCWAYTSELLAHGWAGAWMLEGFLIFEVTIQLPSCFS